MIYVEKAIKHFVDENGEELNDVVENGKSIVTDQGTFREGIDIKVVNESGQVYDGILLKVSTLAPSSPKELTVLDESKVKHVIKYSDIVKLEDMTPVEEEEENN